jgi:transcription antitermination protein NusB
LRSTSPNERALMEYGRAMPVLRQNDDGSGYILQVVQDDRVVVYDLRPEGAQILLNVYCVRVGGKVEDETVEKLIGLRLASLRPEPAPIVPEPTPPPAPAVHERPSDAAPKAVTPRPTPTAEPKPAPIRNQRRTRGREVALQVLYQVEQNPGLVQPEIDRFLQRRLQEPRLCDFARALVNGVKTNQEKIDALITEVAENWRLDRMAAIDRNILRLGAFEMLFDAGVPAKVAINEALELAKRYSTAQSSRFVNGILDRLLTTEAERKAAEAEPKPAEAEPKAAPDPPAEV